MLTSARASSTGNTTALINRTRAISTLVAVRRWLGALSRVLKVDGLPALAGRMTGSSATEVRLDRVESAVAAECRIKVGFLIGALDGVVV